MIANTHYGYVGKSKAPKFTYTGNYKVRDDGVVELLTSGTIVFLEPKVIDLFMVGGGGAGGSEHRGNGGFGGGGGGYTRTVRKVNVVANNPYQVTIGEGAPSGANAVAGGASEFGVYQVLGGKTPTTAESISATSSAGANGGSGGGGGRNSKSDGGAGGSDGANGEAASAAGGVGQLDTTREFGEVAGKLYAGGGGGGTYISAQYPIYAPGGGGGGGAGGWSSSSAGKSQAPGAGGANTGGGGGGGTHVTGGDSYDGASGGSGIVCFRESVELPELAGTWKMNEIMYAPESEITDTVNINYNYKGTLYHGTGVKLTNLAFQLTGAFGFINIYRFDNKFFSDATNRILLNVSGTPSEAFHAWLASNATKQ